MGRTADYSQQTCGIAATLEIVGDPWTILILRDAFRGVRRFEQWQERLGVARNVLAARLKTLVAHGVMETRLYSERPPRNEYVLTDKGQDLRPVLLTLADWGNRHVYGGDAPVLFVHDHCGKPFELTPQINRADRIFCTDNCRVKSYQRRRKQAIAMRAEGTALREIARTLNSDLPTVKRWVGESKKEK